MINLNKFLNKKKNIKNWEDFIKEAQKMNISSSNIGKFLFEDFCYYYYKYNYSNEFKSIYQFKDCPTKIKEKFKLGEGKREYGSDLVLINQNDNAEIVQCKYKKIQGGKLNWTADKLANAFAEARGVERVHVFSNASRIDKHSLNKYGDKTTIKNYEDISSLGEDFYKFLYSQNKDSELFVKEEIFPRKHQSDAIDNIKNYFEHHSIGQVIHPCGTGKSFTSFWAKIALNPKTTVVLVPSLMLLKEVKNKWQNLQKFYSPYLSICSEKEINEQDFLSSLSHIGGKVSTKETEIISFLKDNSEFIIYCTYRSYRVLSRSVNFLGIKLDLLIADEAHHSATKITNNNALLHKDTFFNKKIFFTATQKVSNKASFASMDNEKYFGKIVDLLSFRKSIENKLLTPYKILAFNVFPKDLQKKIEEMKKRNIGDGCNVKDYVDALELISIMNKEGKSHAITFHSNLSDAKKFKELLEKINPNIDIFFLSGKMSAFERSQKISEFKKSNFSILCNAKCLSEGIDIPCVDTVFFRYEKKSTIDIIQSVGRCLRPYTNKNESIVILPIYVLEEKSEIIDYKSNILRLISNLMEMDEGLKDDILNFNSTNQFKKIEILLIDGNEESDVESVKNKFKSFIVKRMSPQHYASFDDARKYARSLKISKMKHWLQHCKKEKPENIPRYPDHVYKGKGWEGWKSWLDKAYDADEFRARRKFTSSLDLEKIYLRNLGDYKVLLALSKNSELPSKLLWKIHSNNKQHDNIVIAIIKNDKTPEDLLKIIFLNETRTLFKNKFRISKENSISEDFIKKVLGDLKKDFSLRSQDAYTKLKIESSFKVCNFTKKQFEILFDNVSSEYYKYLFENKKLPISFILKNKEHWAMNILAIDKRKEELPKEDLSEFLVLKKEKNLS